MSESECVGDGALAIGTEGGDGVTGGCCCCCVGEDGGEIRGSGGSAIGRLSCFSSCGIYRICACGAFIEDQQASCGAENGSGRGAGAGGGTIVLDGEDGADGGVGGATEISGAGSFIAIGIFDGLFETEGSIGDDESCTVGVGTALIKERGVVMPDVLLLAEGDGGA